MFAESQAELDRALGSVNTVVLLTSSLIVDIAISTVRSKSRSHLASRVLAAGAAVGAIFLVLKAFEYYGDVVRGITPQTNEFSCTTSESSVGPPTSVALPARTTLSATYVHM